jgi:hypothetical protein
METSNESSSDGIKNELTHIDPNIVRYFDERDGASVLAYLLPQFFPPDTIEYKNNSCRAWELAGLYYLQKNRPHEALPIFIALYEQMLKKQETGNRIHKGLPLVWICECYLLMGFSSIPKRYLMLTLIEDAITNNGIIDANTSGIYFRLVWRHGLADSVLRQYAYEANSIYIKDPINGLFPEWILQELDNNWMTELPTPQEANVYSASKLFIRYLLNKLGTPTGKELERLAEYILACMPGCRTTHRKRSYSTEYDIICSVEGFEIDFRSELGRYFICECKDWRRPANITVIAKFCRILDSMKSRFGILFSTAGITGQAHAIDAEREIIKVYQDRGMVIIVIDRDDLVSIAAGGNFINLLHTKYESVRLDLLST